MRRIGLVAVAVGLLLGADEPKKGEARKDLEALQGSWTMASLVINGETLPEGFVKTGKLAVEGDVYRLEFGTNSATSTIKVVATGSPTAIDFTYTDGPQKGETVKGIFTLDGDTLTICRGLTEGKGRPTKLAAPAESGLLMVTWKRSKPAGGDRTSAVEQELAKFQGTWQLVAAVADGRQADEEHVKSVRVTIEGRTHTVRSGDRVLAHGVRFEVDPTKTPKEVTDTIEEGPDKGKQIRGIYRLEGDTLISCVAKPGEARPAEFSGAAGHGTTLRVFRRVSPDPDAEAAIRKEQERFEGTWGFASVEMGGKAISLAGFKGIKLVLKGDHFILKEPTATYGGHYAVDTAARPKTIDIIFTEGPEAGKVSKGIYELEGDTYKICVGMAGEPRPSEFASKAGSRYVLEVMKREKP
jgi:uncharacterized protein (TIGR03067 family)